MSYLVNDPKAFKEEATRGLALVHSRRVRRVEGGVVRRDPDTVRRATVVIGGGSGHYPAFAGLVGDGLADGAAMGDIFASPSAQHVISVATAANRGNGVLLTYGNYAGDALNFDAAQQRLRAAGIPCETVRVTDDVASAPRGQEAKRRGIAGDLIVFKTAGAAARRKDSLADVLRVSRLANERTRSFGIAFSGCTLPGAAAPLFEVDPGSAAAGMGIHGETGLSTMPIPSARELASLFVRTLVEEAPPEHSGRVALVLNGLGAVKYEELFLVYQDVAQLLWEQGLYVVDPEVGEFCTSFEMAGLSLTLTWLDEELEQLWREGCDSAAFLKRSTVGLPDVGLRMDDVGEPRSANVVTPASEASAQQAVLLAHGLRAVAEMLVKREEELGSLDAIAGDGDHGIGMTRGARAAADASMRLSASGAGLRSTLGAAAAAWSERAGGTSGALWGLMLSAFADQVGDTEQATGSDLERGFTQAWRSIASAGGAAVGDKTMLDAVVPAAEAFAATRGDLGVLRAARGACDVASDAAQATASLHPRAGRARAHAARAVGHADPGAVSFAYVMRTLVDALAEPREE